MQLTKIRLGHRAHRENAGDFTRKHEFPRALEVHEGLDAEAVPGGKQAPTPGVPDREGPHSVEALNTGIAPLCIGMQDHLAVRTRSELVACGAKLWYQFQVVVDLAVKHQHQAAVGIEHRLRARFGQVENGESTVAKADAFAHVYAAPIRPAVGDGSIHR